MSTLLVEGFDDYGPSNTNQSLVQTLLNSGEWSYGNSYTVCSIVASLNGQTGNAVQLQVSASAANILSKTLAANYSRLIGGFRFSTPLFGSCGVVFYDNLTAQCSVVVTAGSGTLTFRQGSNGTLLQQGVAAVSANTNHYLEFDITFNTSGTLGGWTVWLDGVQVLFGTGVTSQSGDNYANVLQLTNFVQGGGSGTFTVDDLYLFSSSGSLNNSALLSNPVVITQMPTGDHQTQFTNIGNVIGNYFSNEYNVGYSIILANSLWLMPVTPNVNCSVQSIVINTAPQGLGANATANMKGVIYSDSGGVPGSLLKSGTDVVGFVPGQQITLTLTASQSLTAGTQYWIGFINDSNMSPLWYDGVTSKGATASNTFTSGAPATAPAMTGSQLSLYLFALCTGATTNWETEALNPPIGDQSSVSSASVGITDLYTFANMPTNVTEVFAVSVKGTARLTFAGVHAFDLVTSSGGTLGTGSVTNIAPTVSYQGYDSVFDADPHTGAAWTVAGVNASYQGMEIVT